MLCDSSREVRQDKQVTNQFRYPTSEAKQKRAILEMTEWVGYHSLPLPLSLSLSLSLSPSLPSHFVREVHDIEHGTELLTDKLTLERTLHVILNQENFTYISARKEEEALVKTAMNA